MIHTRLAELERNGAPFQIGIIGAGTFGSQIIAQMCRMRGMRIAAIVELAPERALRALQAGGVASSRIREVHSASDIDRAIEADCPVVTGNLNAVLDSRIDLVIEATGNPELGAL
ncbi:MAG: homoserine dehydrogenase, partial [Planctomycetaceae bacterium]|nr:homoserine dehydrogenase [Planctomycetaceae bacterium]